MRAYPPVPVTPPRVLEALHADTAALGFGMASTDATGAMLRALAASRPDGRLLELGTGTGLATAWLLDGMTPEATLDTVDDDPVPVGIARRHLAGDARVRFHVQDGVAFLQAHAAARYDLIFADAFPGKYVGLEAALALLQPGGLYVVDDLLPQPNWPPGHGANVRRFVDALAERPELALWPLDWDTGVLVAARRP